jgi:hypothetical protein
MQVSSMNVSDVLLTTTSFDDNRLKLYYFDQAPIEPSPSSQERFLLTGSANTIQLKFNGTLPNISDIRNKYVYCAFSFIGSSPLYQLAVLAKVESTGFLYNCTYTVPFGTVGRTNITLYYAETIDSLVTAYNFQLSSNAIEFTYADAVSLTTISPLASRANQTVPTTAYIQSPFKATADYGSSSFFAIVSVVNSSTTYSIPATMQGSDGFVISIFSAVPTTLSIDIIMNSRGINRTISTSPVSISFVDGNFLTPSYGTLAGGSPIVMVPYDGPAADQNITLDMDNTLAFRCKYWAVGPQLNCTTPVVGTRIPPYQSLFATVAGKQLSIKYVLIDTRNMTLSNTVFLAGTTITITATLDAPVAITIEGSAVLQISSFTVSNVIRDNMGKLPGNQTIVRTYDTVANNLIAGQYFATLMYFTVSLFETRNMVAFTNAVPIQLLGGSTILYQPNSISAVFVNTPTNVTVTLSEDALSSTILAGLRCKFDSATVTSISYVTGANTITCVVSAAQALVSQLSLWYVSINAPNGGFQLSTNTLNLVSMEQLTLTPIPFITLSSSQVVTLNTSIATPASTYSSYLLYSCLYYDPLNPTPAGSILNNKIVNATRVVGTNQFTCVVAVTVSEPKLFQVLLYAMSLATNQFVLVSSEPALIYFVKQVQLSYVSPFLRPITSTTDSLQITLKTSASAGVFTSAIATDHLLYCKYSTVDKASWLYSTATLLSSTSV